MVTEALALPLHDANPAVNRSMPIQRILLLIVGGAMALLVSGAHLFQSLRAAHDLQVEIEVVSPASFHEEIPRVAHLLVQRADGDYDKLESRCYASAFLDRRSTFRFHAVTPGASQFLFAPAEGEILVAIRSISLRVGNDKNVTPIPLENVEPVQHVEILKRGNDGLVLKTSRADRPPLVRFGLAAPLQAQENGRDLRSYLEAAVLFLAVSAIVLLAIKARPVLPSLSLKTAVPFLVAMGLILSMSVLSRFNAHPDEYLHFETARYFVAHLLPPALDDPAAAPSFGHYGVSYLQDLDASYFLMGKFMAALAWLGTPEIAARLFNVLLFGGAAAYLLARLRGSLAAAVLLISPQIWYVFSYVNGDAWALAVALVAVVQLAVEDSYLNLYLRGKEWRTVAGGGLAFAVLLALLFMAKRNYYLFLPFIGLVAIWKILVWDRSIPRLRLAAKWAAIVVAALVLYLPLRVAHAAINRFELPRLRTEQAEKFAAPGYRPSDIAAGKGARRMALRAQGVSFTELFGEYGWAKSSFESFCGVYHWMSLRSPDLYYYIMGSLYTALLVTIALAFGKLPRLEMLFGAAVLFAMAAVIVLSAYHSWTADFQPQGRYLFPILPMLGFVLYRYRETLPTRALLLLLTGLFAASVCSFVFAGLRAIPQ
ncbi:MAG: hypothetical protein QOH01_2343 [Verrucomicrobiota bacterium]|jgi:hypothetical protein